MSRSVLSPNSALASFEILIDGTPLRDDIVVRRIELQRGLNSLPSLCIEIEDGSRSDQTFAHSSSALFVPGAEIVLRLGYDGQNANAFQGILLAQTIRMAAERGSALIVTCGDIAQKLARLAVPDPHEGTADDAVITALLRDAGLGQDIAPMPGRSARELWQADTAWEVMLRIAAANGLVVTVANGTVTMAAPTFAAPALSATFGEDVIGFELTMDAATQDAAVVIEAYDPEGHDRITARGAEPSVNLQGDLTGDALGKVLDVNRRISSGSAMHPDTLQAWANAIMQQNRLSRFRGEICLPGNLGLVAGELLELKGLGTRFDGNAYIGAVRHVLADGAWQSTVTVGVSDRD
ncbi:phage late control D family protein [Salipiger bermudensis]|uniref:phage late control D family protein n=1 Tax=Salipiger bermudensis TaxID=344736 RepID=UPI001CD2F435|nr:type IV secretion protein Rhs [Salipiger bermudensis]MCA1286936.1 type IV secretion protein Rhs [Salipiger bermudensis]